MKTSARIGGRARSLLVVMTVAVGCAKPNVGKEDAVSPGSGGGDGGAIAPPPDGSPPSDVPRPVDGSVDLPVETARPPDAIGPPVKQPVGGSCMAGPDCQSGKCCAGRCIAASTCCDCNTTPRCSGGNVLSATCDAQGSCNERVTDCGGRGCTGGTCLVCQPGVVSCNGVRLARCKLDGSGFDAGTCHPTCLRAGECCGDLDCGRCNEIYLCRSCDANNRCQATNTDPSCSTYGPCTAAATEACRMVGATCEVRRGRAGPCKFQLCRWANVSLADCGQGANRGIPTPVCHPWSVGNPESVPWGADGACVTQVENITGNHPTMCL
jgi:hypothetical protein